MVKWDSPIGTTHPPVLMVKWDAVNGEVEFTPYRTEHYAGRPGIASRAVPPARKGDPKTMTDDRKPRRYRIELTTPAKTTEEEATRRLRAFLKMAWRSFELRCASASEIDQEQAAKMPRSER